MITDDITSHRIASALRVIADTVPDEPQTPWPGPKESTVHALGNRRIARKRQVALISLSLVGVVVVGSGVAAATGVLSAGSPNVKLAGAAPRLLFPTKDSPPPNSVIRLSEPGPDGSVLIVKSASTNSKSGCISLEIKNLISGSTTFSGSGACFLNYAPGSNQATATPPTYGTATRSWESPTGESFSFLFGKAPSGAATVGVTSADGSSLGSPVNVYLGWFADYLPTDESVATNSLVYYGSTGKVVGNVRGGL